MRIGIDCRLSGKRHAGIGRYIENLVIRLPQLAPDVEWVFFFYDQNQADEVLGRINKDEKNVDLVFTPYLHYSLLEQIRLPKIYQQNKLDLLHVPHFNVPLLYRGKLAITIHDLLWHQHRGAAVTTLKPWEYWFKYFIYRFVSSRAIKKAKAIFVPSKTIKNTILSYYPQAEGKLVVTKEGVAKEFLQSTPTKKSKVSKNLLYVGSLYPHKNVKLIINSLEKLTGYRLSIVSARTAFRDKLEKYVKKLRLSNRVSFKGYLSDSQLATDYQKSFALVQPSLSEGFGLTGLEAMASGVPVIASNIPIFREIYQEAATYFDPNSVESFMKAVAKVEKLDAAQAKKIVEKGKKIVRQYSWEKMAQETLRTLISIH